MFLPGPVAASQLTTRLISAAYNLPLLSFLPQLPLSLKCSCKVECYDVATFSSNSPDQQRKQRCVSRASHLNTRLISAAYNVPLLSFLPQLPLSSKQCPLRRSVCDQLRALLACARERGRERERAREIAATSQQLMLHRDYLSLFPSLSLSLSLSHSSHRPSLCF